jgi:hypothetical protein
MADNKTLAPSWHIAGHVSAIAKTQINDPVEDVFAFAMSNIRLNPDLYPGGCEAIGTEPVLYVARDARLIDAIIQIVCVAFQQKLAIEVWLDRKVICAGSPENGLARVINVQVGNAASARAPKA